MPALLPSISGVVLLALLALPAPAHAQRDRRPLRVAHSIEVSWQGDTCVYSIAEQSAQDTLRIAPGGRLFVYARDAEDGSRGIPASVEVLRSTDGVEGTADGGRPKYLTPNRRMVSFPIRARGGGRTEHEIVLRCCDRIGPEGCADAPRAIPRDGETGALPRAPSSTTAPRGPDAGLAPLRPLPPVSFSGPVMRVED